MARFVKRLTRTDVCFMLVIPTHFMNHIPQVEGGRSENMTVMDVEEREWTFGYYVRLNDNPRPVLRSGWCRYVREKELKVGDRVIFERVNGFQARYRIAASKRITLLGRVVWTDLF